MSYIDEVEEGLDMNSNHEDRTSYPEDPYSDTG